MGKTVKAIVGFVVAIGLVVAGVMTGNPQLIIAGVGVGLSTLKSLKGPKTSPSTTDRLQASIDPRTPRKGAWGDTALNTDVRDQEYTGADKEYLHRFIVVASHAVTSIREIWFDDKLAWTAAGGAQGEFAGYLTVATRLEGTAANAINISARMGATRRYTGCAYVHLRYKLTGSDKKSGGPFASSVPSRVTIIGEGMPVYDPRFDSTVPGGSGAARADDQTTWQYSYSGSNSGRNPACQAVTYLLGWRIQNPVTMGWKLAVGKGVPVERLDLPSFITAANLCDEAVTLAVGGTEPRYRSDGVFSEFDQATDVLDNLKAAMSGELDDMDGLIRLTVLHNDLAIPVVDLTDDDVLGDFNWTPFASLEQSRNAIRGSYVDPSTQSLYQMVPYPDVVIDSPDGIERAEPVNYQFVQSVSQAQRLSKQRLQRAQFGGVFAAEFKSRLWRAQKGDVVAFTFGPAGFDEKLFRIVDMTVQVDGRVPCTLREEHADIYQWDSDESPAVESVDSTPYSNLDLPIIQMLDTVDEGATAGATLGIDVYLDDGTTVATETGSTGLLNAGVTIAASGTLSGGGGGQVTFGGLGGGAVGLQNDLWLGGTYLRDSTGTNALTETGTYGLRNSGVTIASNGTLAGAGGGQVTFGGLGGGAVGTQATLSLGGSYLLDGAGHVITTTGTYGVLNSGLSISAAGALSGGGGGQVTYGGLGGGNVGLQNTLLLGGTYLRDSGGTNVLTETGTYGLRNSGLSISAAGALSGGGGGQVTFGGLGGGTVGTLTTFDFANTSYSTGLLPTTRAATGLVNANLSISAAGALSGGGGGQVTFGGLGGGAVGQQATLLLGGTYLRDAGGTNVLTETGTYGLRNSGLSISAAGALSGGGGGQVTFGGLGGGTVGTLTTFDFANTSYSTGLLPTTRAASGLVNANLSISAAGALSGGGGGQVTFGGLGGGAVGQQSTLLLGGTYLRDAGGTNVLTETGTYGLRNSGLSISAAGALSGGGGGQVTISGLDSDILARILSMRGDNLVRNGDFSEGQTKMTLGGTAAYVALGAGDPAPHGVKFLANATQANSYFYPMINSPDHIPVTTRRLYLSIWIDSGNVATDLIIVAYCGDGQGNDLGYVNAYLPVAAHNDFREYRAVLDLPAGAAYYTNFYIQRYGTNTGLVMFTQIRIGVTQRNADNTNEQPIVGLLSATTGRATTSLLLGTATMVGIRNTNDVALTAADVGTTATITVPSHERRVPGASGVELRTYNSGTITGRAFSTAYYVYCDDPGFAGGAVTYISTTNSDDLANSVNRVFVGYIVTPADGAGGTGGGGSGGGGGGGGGGQIP